MEQRQSFEEEFSRTGGKLSLIKGLPTNGGASLFGCLSPLLWEYRVPVSPGSEEPFDQYQNAFMETVMGRRRKTRWLLPPKT